MNKNSLSEILKGLLQDIENTKEPTEQELKNNGIEAIKNAKRFVVLTTDNEDKDACKLDTFLMNMDTITLSLMIHHLQLKLFKKMSC